MEKTKISNKDCAPTRELRGRLEREARVIQSKFLTQVIKTEITEHIERCDIHTCLVMNRRNGLVESECLQKTGPAAECDP